MLDAARAHGELEARCAALASFAEARNFLRDPAVATAGLGDLKRQAAEQRAVMQALTASVLEKQARASALRKSLEDFALRTPELERQKQLAVSGKNYKEAARIAAEIKDMAASETDQQTELANINAALFEESGKLETVKKSAADLQSSVEITERARDTELLALLKTEAVALRQRLQDCAAAPTADPAASATILDISRTDCEVEKKKRKETKKKKGCGESKTGPSAPSSFCFFFILFYYCYYYV
jgi:hypothetical protein